MKNSPERIFSESRWIWPDNHCWDIQNSYALFRKDITLDVVPSKAPLYITADQSYQLYVNGTYVCRGPARGFQEHWPYDEVDIRINLRKGRNVLAVRAHNPGLSNFQYVSRTWAGLLVAAKWGKTIIRSDKSWKCRRQIGVKAGTVPTSLQLFPQEHVDLRIEDPSWMFPDFDDSLWTTHVAEHVWNGMPWPNLASRGIPMLEEREIAPLRCLGAASGTCAADYLSTRDVTRTRFSEGLSHAKSTPDVSSLSVEPLGEDGFRSYLLDFGRTVVGSFGVEIKGAEGGEVVDTLCVETIQADTLTPDFVPDMHSRMAFGQRLICRPGQQTYWFYHAFGFRYVVVTVRRVETKLSLRPFLRTAIYPLEQKGSFRSSDATLNGIWEVSAWTQRICSLDAFVDTPWREQAQWWGDARVQAKNTFFLSGDTRLFRRGLGQVAGQTLPNGLTYGHAPTSAHGCILPDFTLIWLITFWDYYWQTGTLEAFLENELAILKALEYFEERTDPSLGLVAYDRRYWLFLDWTGIFKEGYSTVYNLWLLIALEKASAMFAAAGRPDPAKRLSKWAARLRKALRRFVNKDGLLCDGLTFEGRLVPSTSIHAQTLAMMAEFLPSKNSARLDKSLLPFIRREVQPEVTPSCYWVTYVFEILAVAGYGQEVVEYIRDRWKPMIEHGTTWELFEPKIADESFSHAWSAHPLFHFMQTLGGIRQLKVGWREIVFEPVFIGDHADVIVPSPLGKIRSTWQRKGGKIHAKLSLPAGVEASVRFSGRKIESAVGDSSWVLEG